MTLLYVGLSKVSMLFYYYSENDASIVPCTLHIYSSACTKYALNETRYKSRIRERIISLRFLGIILRVLRLEVFAYIVYITNQFQTTFAWGGGRGGVKSVSRGDCE